MRAGQGGEGRRRDDEEMRGGVGRTRRLGAGVQERERDEGLSEEARKGDKGGSSSKRMRGDQVAGEGVADPSKFHTRPKKTFI